MTRKVCEICGGPIRRLSTGQWVHSADDYDPFARVHVPRPREIVVYFQGGPWNEQTCKVERVVGPLFAVGHEIGNHYWLDSKSDPPTYYWREAQAK